MADTWAEVERVLYLALGFLVSHYEYVAGLMTMVFIMVILYVHDSYATRKHNNRVAKFHAYVRGENRMTTPEMENLEKVLIGDGITDVLEDLEYRGKMSRERVMLWYRRFGNLLNLPDLLQRHEVMLKDRIRQQIGKNSKVIPFPDNPGKANGRNRLLARLDEQAKARKESKHG